MFETREIYMTTQNVLLDRSELLKTDTDTGPGPGVSVAERQNIIKHLIFSLGSAHFGIELSSVKEVIGLSKITPVPHVPSFFKGLINLRGKIISVIDLRVKLSLPETKYRAKKTSIIITDINDLTIGTIVDDVNEVVGFKKDQIVDNLKTSSGVRNDYVTKVAKSGDDSLVPLLNISRVLDAKEIGIMKNQSAL